MRNFYFYNGTKIYFGDGEVKKVGSLIKEYGSNVLLVYGKGSIKRIGLYDQVMKLLKESNVTVYELAGVDPNPRLKSVIEGSNICKDKNIDIILAVGGGSAIDCAKGIAMGAKYDGNPWDFYTRKVEPKEALPLATILTLSATGTEMNGNSVISNLDTKEKKGFGSRLIYPVFSILDPKQTYSVSQHQTACGIVDSLTHIYEFYFNQGQRSYLNSRICEAIMKTIIEFGPIAYNDPTNYEARANLMFASTLALNGITGFGKYFDGFNHSCEHALSAIYDITHADGLAILAPHWMEYILNKDNEEKFYEFAVNVWGVKPYGSKYDVAKAGIQAVFDFYKSLNMPHNLRDVGIDNPDIDAIIDKTMAGPSIGQIVKLTAQDVRNILNNVK